MELFDAWTKAPGIKYGVIGKEICPKTGKEHMQCYFEFEKKKTQTGIKKLFGDNGIHIEARSKDSTAKQASDYCKKDGKWVEWGEISHQGERKDLVDVRRLAMEGGMRRVLEQEKVPNLQQIRVAEKYLQYCEKARHWKPVVTWLWGASGVGKSRKAREMCKGGRYFTKNTANKWWDGYDGEEIIIIDDFRDDWWPMTYMLALLDRYEMKVEIKGGCRQILATDIIITSIKPPERMYLTSDEDIAQLTRRVDVVEEVSKLAGGS